MATYGPNDPDAFFHSAMADLDDHGQNFDMEEDDQFSDALEQQWQYDATMGDSKAQLPDSNVSSGSYSRGYNGVYNEASNESYTPSSTFVPTLPQHPDGKVAIGSYAGVYKGVYDDAINEAFDQADAPSSNFAPTPPMFAQTNNVPKAKPNEMRFSMPARPEHYNPFTEPEEKIKVNKSSASEKHTAAYHNIFKKSSDTSQVSQSQHTSGCSGSRGASTPPATPPPPQQQQQQPAPTSSAETNSETKPELQLSSRPWNGPDDLRDVAKPFLREKRWHDKVAHLHPSIPLASHRYWIGVLNLGQDPRSASKETHFTWMKGNRLTTVETVRNVYAATTMMEGVFMMGGERPEDETRMEELDLFNDKVVLFKIAEEGTPASVGRLITEGLVTKETVVVELND